jgi:hypothetical protein
MNKKAEDEEKRNDRAGINRKEAIWKGKRQRRRRHRRNKGVDVFGCGVKKKCKTADRENLIYWRALSLTH